MLEERTLWAVHCITEVVKSKRNTVREKCSEQIFRALTSLSPSACVWHLSHMGLCQQNLPATQVFCHS